MGVPPVGGVPASLSFLKWEACLPLPVPLVAGISPPPLFLRRVGASSPPSCRANSQKFSDFLSNEVMLGGSKVRPTPQEISRPEVLTFPTFDPPTAGSANPSKNYREKQRKFRPSSETKILYNLGTRETAQRRKPLLRAV